MLRLFTILLGFGLATGALDAATNRVARPARTAPARPAAEPESADPIEQAYARLLARDDAAHAEVDGWIRENEVFSAGGADYTAITLNARIERRLKPVRDAYEGFLLRHPKHVRARLAFGSFLSGIGEDDAALAQWERARDLDPDNPAAWNNLADHFARLGPLRKAFECLDRAVALRPSEAVYVRNLASLVFLSGDEARDHYKLPDEQAVLRRALDLYRRARQLDPDNFTLATDLAQVYYRLEPPHSVDAAHAKAATDQFADEALAAWQDARKLARTELDRQGISLHLARICLAQERWADARRHLDAITEPSLAPLKQDLVRVLDRKASAASAQP
jgi:tetratricopeptide (TPR) repeat protein